MAPLNDIPIDEFRSAADRAVDWIARYLALPDDYPVLSKVRPNAIKAALPETAPREGEPLQRILDDFESIVVPGITHWNHPGFFAYFSISGSAPGIIGELLSAALNINGMLWQTSPAATELEEVAVAWLRRLLGLPDGFEGVINDTASVSTLCAIAAARHALIDLEIRDRGMSGRTDLPLLTLYTSEQAHSSVEKAAIVLGIGKAGVRKIPTDSTFRMDVSELRQTMSQDRAAGHRPFCVVATAGTTSTTAVDPIPEIAAACSREGVWLHVDAAYGGSAAIAPAYRWVLDGCDRADSIVVNPHKWLFTPIDCSVLYTRHPDTLTGAFSLVPEYLRTGVEGTVRDYMDWGVSLGRRFRALKLWMVMRSFGAEGIARRLDEHCRLARTFANWVDDHPHFERLAPVPLSVVCFRARPPGVIDAEALSSDRMPADDGDTPRDDVAGTSQPTDIPSGGHQRASTRRSDERAAEHEAALDSFNRRLLQRLNATGEIYLSHTSLAGRFALRLAVGNIRTTERHVARAWELIRRETAALEDEDGPD